MAVTETIQELLQGIDSAQYGREMRQFIHKGIQKCYEEGSAGETDPGARERLDEVEASVSEIGTLYEMPYDMAATPSVASASGKPTLLVMPKTKLAFLHGWWDFNDDPTLINSLFLYLYNLPIPAVEMHTRFPIVKNASDIVIAKIENASIPSVTGDNDKRGVIWTIGKTDGIYGVSLCYPYKELADAYPLSSGTIIA
jgi:hypothetical protein